MFFRRFVLMLRKFIYILLLFFVTNSFAQDKQERDLANDYFRKGEFEKAANLYQKQYDKQKHSVYLFKKLIHSWQALEEYKKVEIIINERIKEFPKQSFLWVELGYNFDLQHKVEQAKIHYEKAAKALRNKPASGYQIARAFYDYHLLDYSLQSYLLMQEANYTFHLHFL